MKEEETWQCSYCGEIVNICLKPEERGSCVFCGYGRWKAQKRWASTKWKNKGKK